MIEMLELNHDRRDVVAAILRLKRSQDRDAFETFMKWILESRDSRRVSNDTLSGLDLGRSQGASLALSDQLEAVDKAEVMMAALNTPTQQRRIV